MRLVAWWLPGPWDKCPTGRGRWSWTEEPLTVAAAEQEGEAAQVAAQLVRPLPDVRPDRPERPMSSPT